jgi:N-methylhydantoinase A
VVTAREGNVKGYREAYFPEQGKFIECPVYDRYSLRPGARLKGPAIVEERESTTIIGGDSEGFIDNGLNLIINREGG